MIFIKDTNAVMVACCILVVVMVVAWWYSICAKMGWS